MTKRELQEYQWIKRNIEKLEERLEELRTAAARTTTQLKQDPIHSGGMGDKVGSAVANIVSVQEEIDEELGRAYAVMLKIERAIQILPAREMYLIRAKYIELKHWEQICVDMNYSWRQIHYIHADALRILAENTAHICTPK